MSAVNSSPIKQEQEEFKEESSVLEDMPLDILGKHFRLFCVRVLSVSRRGEMTPRN